MENAKVRLFIRIIAAELQGGRRQMKRGVLPYGLTSLSPRHHQRTNCKSEENPHQGSEKNIPSPNDDMLVQKVLNIVDHLFPFLQLMATACIV
jgi:hypothetical protein